MIALDQPRLIADLLDELCQTRVTRSAVSLAASLVDRGRLSEMGDPVSLVTSIVEDLSQAGLVSYTLRHDWSHIPLHIRVTRAGYEAAGYAIIRPETGSRAADRVRVDRGPTDWRSLDPTTWGGPIERMSLTEHLLVYPSHRSIHPDPLTCGHRETRNTMAVSAARTDQVRSIIIGRGGQASASDIQAGLHLSNEPAYRAINDALDKGLIERVGPKGARGTYYVARNGQEVPESVATEVTSTRQAVLSIVERAQPIDSVKLFKALARDFPALASNGPHKVQHLVHQLIKQGELEGRVDRYGSMQTVVAIRLAKRRPTSETPEPVAADPEPEELTVPDVSPEPVAQDRPSYPILAQLLERDVLRASAQARADALLAAASVLESVDPEESERLFDRANVVTHGAEMTPLETEYLAYAKERPLDD